MEKSAVPHFFHVKRSLDFMLVKKNNLNYVFDGLPQKN